MKQEDLYPDNMLNHLTLSMICIMSLAVFRGQAMANDVIEKLEAFRTDQFLKPVDERRSTSRGHGRTLLAANQKRYFIIDLDDCADQIKISKLSDGLALASYLRDPDPKMRWIALYAIMKTANIGKDQSKRFQIEQILVWERCSAPQYLACQQTVFSAFAHTLSQAKSVQDPAKPDKVQQTGGQATNSDK